MRKEARLTLRLPAELKAQLEERAAALDMPVAIIVRAALRVFFAQSAEQQMLYIMFGPREEER